MFDTLARLISFILNPYFLFFPLPYLLVLHETENPIYSLKWTLFAMVFVGCIGASVAILVWRGYFSDLDISKREQRPLFFTVLFLYALLFLTSLILLRGPIVLYIGLFGIFLSIFIFSFINTRLKASIHVGSISALIFAFSFLYGGAFLLLLILIPLVGWSRVRIKRHTKQEVVMGGIIGILLTIGMYIFFKFVLGVDISGNI